MKPSWMIELLRNAEGEGGAAAGGGDSGDKGAAAGGGDGGDKGAAAGGGDGGDKGAAAGGGDGGDKGAAAGGGDAPKPFWETMEFQSAEMRDFMISQGLHRNDGKEATIQQALEKALKGLHGATKKLGGEPGSLIPKPGKDQAVSDYFKANAAAFGVPEKADDYKIERPQLPDGMAWDEGLEKSALSAFAEMGMPKAFAEGAVKMFAQYQAEQFKNIGVEMAGAKQEMMAALAKDWGAQTPERTQAATLAFNAIAEKAGIAPADRPAVAARMSETMKGADGKAGDAQLIRMFYAIAEGMQEGELSGFRQSGGGLGATPAEAKVERQKLQASPEYTNALNAGGDAKKAMLARVEQLNKIIAQAGK